MAHCKAHPILDRNLESCDSILANFYNIKVLIEFMEEE